MKAKSSRVCVEWGCGKVSLRSRTVKWAGMGGMEERIRENRVEGYGGLMT